MQEEKIFSYDTYTGKLIFNYEALLNEESFNIHMEENQISNIKPAQFLIINGILILT